MASAGFAVAAAVAAGVSPASSFWHATRARAVKLANASAAKRFIGELRGQEGRCNNGILSEDRTPKKKREALGLPSVPAFRRQWCFFGCGRDSFDEAIAVWIRRLDGT